MIIFNSRNFRISLLLLALPKKYLRWNFYSFSGFGTAVLQFYQKGTLFSPFRFILAN